MSELPPVSPLLIAAELACWLAGLVLLVSLLMGRLGPNRPALVPWRVTMEGFVMSILLVIGGGLMAPQILPQLCEPLLDHVADQGGWWQVLTGLSYQLGLLGGAGLSLLISRISPPPQPAPAETTITPPPAPPLEPRTRHPLLAGIATFAIILPLITGIGYLCKLALTALGMPIDEQSLVDLFRNTSSPALLGALIFTAVVIAPMTEEVIFRAGLFRYLRTRIPRWIAYVVPALVFSLLHSSIFAFVPLFAFGLALSYAYERTGRIAVPMIAHGLFNLHTILLVLAGVTT